MAAARRQARFNRMPETIQQVAIAHAFSSDCTPVERVRPKKRCWQAHCTSSFRVQISVYVEAALLFASKGMRRKFAFYLVVRARSVVRPPHTALFTVPRGLASVCRPSVSRHVSMGQRAPASAHGGAELRARDGERPSTE
jgi:hypothetical protein